MREVVKRFNVCSYDELTDDAKTKANVDIYQWLSDGDIPRDNLRQFAAHWLTEEGWEDLAELEWAENGPDLDKMQFSIAHVQGDFVIWSATKPYCLFGDEVTVRTTMRPRSIYPYMDIKIEEEPEYWHTSEMINRYTEASIQAEHLVKVQQSTLLRLMHEEDIRMMNDSEYLADMATANGLEFLQDGSMYLDSE